MFMTSKHYYQICIWYISITEHLIPIQHHTVAARHINNSDVLATVNVETVSRLTSDHYACSYLKCDISTSNSGFIYSL